MNGWVLRKTFRQQYRMYALRISVIAHVILIVVLSFIVIRSEIQEYEDEIQVELFSELPRELIIKKQVIQEPIVTEETTPTPIREKLPLKKQAKVIEPNTSLDIAKLPVNVPKAVEIPPASPKPIDADPTLLSTDADLPTMPEAVLSARRSVATDNVESYTRRRLSGVKNPRKRPSAGISKPTEETGAGKKPGTGIAETLTGQGTGGGTADSGEGSTFSSVIGELTEDIIASSGGLPLDVVFVVDASGSMGDNINAVAEHLGQMIDAYTASEIDYQLGLTHFKMKEKTNSPQNSIKVFQLTRNLSKYKQELYSILPTGDENALDAVDETVKQLRFRSNTIKHLIVVTDEPFTSLHGLSVNAVISVCRRNELYVNVLGNNTAEHRELATQTGGTWHAIPQDPIIQPKANPPKQVGWGAAQQIGNAILSDATNQPVDVILFLDGSQSMKDKILDLSQQINLWVRNWDNALIDYRLGVVRFYRSGNTNRINVFKPPQTQADLHKIFQLPCRDDEHLLQAVADGIRHLELRRSVKTHFILITDEPGDPQHPIAGTIGLLKELPVVVSVIGAADAFQQQVALQTGGVFVTLPNAYTQNQQFR